MEVTGMSLRNDDCDMPIDISQSLLEGHIPNCDLSLKPVVGQKFKTLDDGVQFYRMYARASGFDIRLGSTKSFKHDGSYIWRYVYCNREGKKNSSPDDVCDSSKQKRRRVSKRVGCMARVVFRSRGAEGYVVTVFLESHCHPLVPDQYKKYLKVNRNLGHVHKNHILNCARANIGPMKSYRLFKEAVGSYPNVGCTGDDYKNFSRDLRAYIDGCDAQMLLNKFFQRKESCSAFFFEYSVDKDDNLKSIFWADPIARRNYSVFGDVVSFDCTYATNRYDMIFAPFTGKDNHGKLVTFGAALLSGEAHKSYTWVFEKFAECMGRHPSMIITDQDPAMKIPVKVVFPGARHRLCMWHIMMKVPEKTPVHLKKDDSFRKRLNGTVWTDLIEPSVFEEQWNAIMIDFGLTDNSWFNSLYDIRNYWIPAYFRDHPMSGLCRTTSISESVNSFFQNYLTSGSNLIEFMMHFDSALDAQRYSNDIQNSKDYSSQPQLKTPLPFEKHAATIYTNKLFDKVQEEIEASCYSCSVVSIKESGSTTVYEVNDGNNAHLYVSYNKDDDSAVCSCKKFIRDGLLCCHIFLLFKLLKWDCMPDKYIVPRWTRSAYSKPLNNVGDCVFDRCVVLEENKLLINQLVSDFYTCVGAVEGDNEKTHILLAGIHALKDALVSEDSQSYSSSARKSNLFELFYGASKPDEVVVNPPLPVKTKGSGSGIEARKKAAMERAKKPPRTCSKCGEKANHDARNCPTNSI